MTRKDLEYLQKILKRIKDPDGHIAKALAMVNRDLVVYDARRGQLQEQYVYDDRGPW